MRDLIDNWRAWNFTCKACGWKGMGSDLEFGDLTELGCDVMCPSCRKGMDWLEFPHVTELKANLEKMTSEDRAKAEEFMRGCDDWHSRKLHSPDELPDIAAPYMVIFWDEDHEAEEIVLRFGDREIFRMPDSYEYYDFFVEACRVLKTKYGKALLDVIPTANAYVNMWGDCLRAPEICDKMRALIRHDTDFWGERGPHDFYGVSPTPPRNAWKHFDPHRAWDWPPRGEDSGKTDIETKTKGTP